VFDKLFDQTIMRFMLRHHWLSVATLLIAIGLLASLALDWPARDVELVGVSFALSGRTLLGLILVGLVWAGSDSLLRHHPLAAPGLLGVLPLGWVLPTVWVVAAWLLLPFAGRIAVQVLGIAAVCALLALTAAAEYYVADPASRWRAGVQFVLHLATYLAAMLLYTAIRLGVASRGTATASVAVASAVLAWRLCAGDDRIAPSLPRLQIKELGALDGTALGRGWVFVALGILTAASCWLLGLWTRPPLLFGLVLVVLLYVGVGLLKQFLLQTLTQRVVAEYLVVGVVALLLPFLVR
jgi:hypothetical protein